jgi:DNA-binding response OmpR family regulator
MKEILIIDDDKTGIIPLTVRLKAAGYRVRAAYDGLEGLKLAVEHPPDLIIMDVWMPHGMGILTAQRLKHIGLAHVPVIFVTASTRESLWPFAEEVEPAGFFEKPFDSKQLLANIAMLLGTDTQSAAAQSGAAVLLQP